MTSSLASSNLELSHTVKVLKLVEKVHGFYVNLAIVPASFDNRINFNEFPLILLIENVNSDHWQVLELELVKEVHGFHVDLAIVPTSFDNRIN